MLRQLGLSIAEVGRHRICDSRNPLPAAGAREVRPGLLRLSYLPRDARWPADIPVSAWL